MNFVCRQCERDNEVYDEQLMEWMRERVRCATCRWRMEYQQGFKLMLESCWACGNIDSPWYMSPVGGDESCATHWESKEG